MYKIKGDGRLIVTFREIGGGGDGRGRGWEGEGKRERERERERGEGWKECGTINFERLY